MTNEKPSDAGARHDHGPSPSYEWIVEGDQASVLPHLRSLAPTLTFEDGHFDVSPMDRAERGLPALFTLQLGEVPIGGVDFLPLPSGRTLMRLYLCSDLGTACQLEDGDQIAIGFVEVWLNRLQRLGFMAASAPPATGGHRRLGFATRGDR